MKRAITVFMSLIIIAIYMSVNAFADGDIDSGTYHDVDWRITQAGELIIGKEGKTQTFNSANNAFKFPWIDYTNEIVSIDFLGTVKGCGDMSGMFHGCKNIVTIDLDGFDTKNVTDMGWMFSECEKLKKLDLRMLDTSNVKDMNYMLGGCKSLVDLDISTFDTGNVTDMSDMFHGSTSLTGLDLSNFNTKNVVDMSSMFSSCESLKNLDLSNFDTRNVENMGSMFSSCFNLEHIDISSFNTQNVGRSPRNGGGGMSCMFSYCRSLKGLDLSNFDTENVTDMSHMFNCCESLKSLDLSNFSTGNVVDMFGMFLYCVSLDTLNISSFNTSNTEDMREMFSHCSSLTKLDLSSFDTTKAGSLGNVPQFTDCSSLTELDLAGFNTSGVTDMFGMFENCSSLTDLDLTAFDTKNVTNMGWMFKGCTSLQNLDLSSFDTDKVNYMRGMFEDCDSLAYLNFKNFSTEGLDDGELYVFSGLSSLRWLNLSNANIKNITSMRDAFSDCSSLKVLDLSSFDTSNVENMAGMFALCTSLQSIRLGNFNTEKVTNMYEMFASCCSLRTIDLSNFNTENVEDMAGMFCDCYKLRTLDLSNFNTEKVRRMNRMFQDCYNLRTVDLSNFGTSKVTNTYHMFENCRGLETLDLSTFDLSSNAYSFYSELSGTNLGCLKTPNYSGDFYLPYEMYDREGNVYKHIKNLDHSLTLYRERHTDNPYKYKDADEVPVPDTLKADSIKLFEDASGNMGDLPITKIYPAEYSLKLPAFETKTKIESQEDGTYKIRMSIGTTLADRENGILSSEEKWDSYMKDIEDARMDYSKMGFLYNSMSKYGKAGDTKTFTPTSKLKAEVDAVGFYEAVVDQRCNIISDKGGIIITVEGKNTWTKHCVTMPIPIPYYIELGGSVKAEGTGEFCWLTENSGVTFSGTVEITPEIIAGIGAGIKKMASVGVEGKAAVKFQVCPPSKADFTGTVSIVMTALTIEYEVELAQTTISIWDTTQHNGGGFRNSKPMATVDTIDRSFQTMTTDWDGDSGGALQEHILPTSVPQMATIGDKQVLVFQANDEERANADCLKLVYSVYDGKEWSEPKAVYDNGAADGKADLKVIGDKLYVTWQKCKSKAESDDASELAVELAQKCEICVAVFDEETEKFTGAQYVTNDKELDMMPVLVSKNNTPAVVWVQSAACNLFDTEEPKFIMTSEMSGESWKSGQILDSADGYVSEMDAYYDGSGYVAAVDASDMEANSQYIRVIKKNSSTNIADSTKTNFSGICFGDGMMRYVEDGVLKKYDLTKKETTTIESGETQNMSANALEFSNAEKTAVVWMLNGNDGCSIYSSVKTDSGYSEPVVIYNEPKLIGNYFTAQLEDDGSWKIILNASKSTNSKDASLYFIEKNQAPKVEVTATSVNESEAEDDVQPVSYLVKNNSEETITEYDLTMTTVKGTYLSKTVSCNLLPGEEMYCEEEITIDSNLDGESLEVKAVADGQEDMSNTFMSDEINLTNLSLDVDKVVISDELTFTAKVCNSGLVPAGGKVSFYKDAGKTIKAKEEPVDTLHPGEVKSFSWTIESEDISLDEDDIATFAISMESDDNNASDNEYYGVLYKDEMPDAEFAGTLVSVDTLRISGIKDKAYTGEAITQDVVVRDGLNRLTENVDYVLEYKNNVNVGGAIVTIIGTGDYTGSVDVEFEITRAQLGTLTLSQTSYDYDGSVKTPSVTVKSVTGKTLTEGNDYEISYPGGRIAAGAYTITVIGVGNYTGSLSENFVIKESGSGGSSGRGGGSSGGGGGGGGGGDSTSEADKTAAEAVTNLIANLPETISLTDASSIAAARTAYDALTEEQKKLVDENPLKKAETKIAALITDASLDTEAEIEAVRQAYNALTESEKALVDITKLEAAEKAWKEYNENVEAAKTATVKIKSIKAKKGRKVVVRCDAPFQVRYSLKKNSGKLRTVTGKKTTLTKLKAGKRYYFQVRPVSEVRNEVTGESVVVYGEWSRVKSVKVKR